MSQISGLNYGRLDLKVPSYKFLEEGRDVIIFEINGVNSEPGHIYDLPTVFGAYKDIAKHCIALIKVSTMNIKKGVKITPLKIF